MRARFIRAWEWNGAPVQPGTEIHLPPEQVRMLMRLDVVEPIPEEAETATVTAERTAVKPRAKPRKKAGRK